MPTARLQRPANPLAGGGVHPERSRGTRQVSDTVEIHVNTILAAREAFRESNRG